MKTSALLIVAVFFLAACGGEQGLIRQSQAGFVGSEEDTLACKRLAIKEAPNDWYAEGVPYGRIGPYTHIGPYSRVKGPTEGSYLQLRKQIYENCIVERSRVDPERG